MKRGARPGSFPVDRVDAVNECGGGPRLFQTNPEGDRLDNFGEWAFGTHPGRPDDEVAATSLVLVGSSSSTLRFSHRRLEGPLAAGLVFDYRVSEDLVKWTAVMPIEESVVPLPASPGYEVVTLRHVPVVFIRDDKDFVGVTVAVEGAGIRGVGSVVRHARGKPEPVFWLHARWVLIRINQTGRGIVEDVDCDRRAQQ